MALGENFYNEIFEQERKWIELINSNLLNSVYCKLTLKPFYIEKKNKLEKEYVLTHDENIKLNITIINNILEKIEYYNEQYENYRTVNIKSLIPLFFVQNEKRLSLNKEKKKEIISDKKNKLQELKYILENQTTNYDSVEVLPDYVYDDFPQEIRRVK